MTEKGIEPIKEQIGDKDEEFNFPQNFIDELKKDDKVYQNFEQQNKYYQRLKCQWIFEGYVKGNETRQQIFEKRLAHYCKNTKKGKTYGKQPLLGIFY